MHWRTDRRGLLKAGGAALAGLAMTPKLAWAQDGTTLRLRVAADFQVLDPFGIIGELDDIIPRCTQVTLIRVGDMREGSPIINYAAETFDWVDPQTIAFTLREGLMWNNGYGPVTTEDVKFSFERIAGSDSAWAYQFDHLDHVEIVDARSGIIHLTAPFAPFTVIALPYYGGHIVCKAAVEAVGGSYTTEIPASCGPFVMESWEQQQRVILVPNPDWTGEKSDFDRIEIYIVTDDQAALLAYQADAYDFTRLSVGGARVVREAMPEGATLIEAPSTTYTWLSININAPQLQDIRVRQAIQYAYDSDAVLQGAYDGAVPRSAGVIQPSSEFARPSNIIATRDVEKARALLEEAGVSGLTLNLYTLTDSNSQTIAQIIQASMAEAGINIEIQPTEDAAYWALGDMAYGDGYQSIELTLMGFAGGLDPTENLVWFMPDQIGYYNWSFFDNAEYVDLFGKAQSEIDPDARRAIFNRMEDLMEESGGFVFICFEPYLAIHDNTLAPMILADGHPDPTRFRKL